MNPKVIIYSDGGVRNNQSTNNIGGWGTVTIAYDAQGNEIQRKEKFGGAINTTNNIMELTATINALGRLNRTDIPVEVYVDSNYVLQGITDWIHVWKRREWKKSNNKPVENVEYWKELDKQVNRFDYIRFFKVKAHVGIELNELADKLANRGMDSVS